MHKTRHVLATGLMAIIAACSAASQQGTTTARSALTVDTPPPSGTFTFSGTGTFQCMATPGTGGAPDVGTGGMMGTGGAGTGGMIGTGGAGTGGAIVGTGGAVAANCAANPTITFASNRILDTSGTPVTVRGGEIVYDGRNEILDPLVSAANGLRLLLTIDAANGLTPASFDAALARATAHGNIVWLSLFTWNDAAGTPAGLRPVSAALGGGSFYALTEVPGCSKATPKNCYLSMWSRQWLKALAAKYAGHIIIDAMQEYTGTPGVDSSTEAGRVNWAADATDNVVWFRANGYTAPLEIMSNFGGRDLGAIVEKGAAIRAADTVMANGQPQTMFGWQAYWADPWYKGWQGDQLLGHGQTITGAQAIHQFAMTQGFPIEIGLDNYPGDTGSEYLAEMNQAAADNATWLWWAWNANPNVECPVDTTTCQAAVMTTAAGFPGAVRSACGAPPSFAFAGARRTAPRPPTRAQLGAQAAAKKLHLAAPAHPKLFAPPRR